MHATDPRLSQLDGLRGIAALHVFVAHIIQIAGFQAFSNVGGQIGVMLFFVLSGFLMGHLYINEELTAGAIGRFLQRRAARVLPLYFAVVIASHLIVLLVEDSRYYAYAVTPSNISEHLLMVRARNALWTIPVEVKFYLVFPLIWLLRQHAVPLFCLLFVAITIHLLNAPGLYVQMPWHYFAAGVLISLLPLRRGLWADLLFLASLAAMLLLYPDIGHLAPTVHESTLPGIAYAMWSSPVYLLVIAVFMLAVVHSGIASALLGSAPLRYLGAISYSLYILHQPTLWYLERFTDLTETPVLFALAAAALVLFASTASYFVLEVPARRYINGLSLPRSLPAAR